MVSLLSGSHRSALLLLAGIAEELHRLGLGKLERKARQGHRFQEDVTPLIHPSGGLRT